MINYEAYLRAHFSEFGVLIVELGRFCPVECAHCHVESDRSTRDRLPIEQICSSIEQFAGLPNAEFVALTGGEPFSYRDALSSAIDASSRYGLKSYVLTSALWASSAVRAERLLKSVGIPSLLGVSIDRYHLVRVPLERPLNALRAAAEVGSSPFLALGSFGPTDPIRREVKAALQAADLGAIQIINYPLLARGKGAGLPELQGRTLDNPANEGCLSIGTPVLTTRGAISACCHTNVANSIRAGEYDRLILGDDANITGAYHRYRSDPLMQTIQRHGPLELAMQSGIAVPEMIANGDMCEVCDYTRRALRERELSEIKF
jgi:hypothetical protein